MADPIHKVDGGAFWHHGSDWIFPQEIGGFVLVGIPQDVDGTSDAVAYYARVKDKIRTTAVVDVYPRDSAAAEATLANAKAAIELKLKSAKVAAVQSESPFKVGKDRELVGVKVSYNAGAGTRTNLYFFDTGAWIVKIRVMADAGESDMAQASDSFVREQRWESLRLSDATCTGAACK